MSELREKEIEERKQLADECMAEAKTLFYESRLKESEELVNRARHIYEDLGILRECAAANNLLGVIHRGIGNSALEADSYLEAIGYAIEAGDDAIDLLATLYNNIGALYKDYGAWEKALEYMIKSADYMAKAPKEKKQNAYAFNLIVSMNLCELFYMMDNLVEAERYLEEARKMSQCPENENFYFSYKAFESLMLWRLGHEDEVKADVDARLREVLEGEMSPDYVEYMTEMIHLFKEMGENDKWRRILEQMEYDLRGEDNLLNQATILEHWMDYYKTIGDEEKYIESCVRYAETCIEKKEYERQVNVDSIDIKVNLKSAEKQRQHDAEIIYMDSLTGIGNRNKMLKDSEAMIRNSIANHSAITIGLLDIDFFKECNDSYGHIKGDECLRTVASIIDESIGENGNVYRYGGDEFLVLLGDMEPEEVREIGRVIKERLREANLPNTKSTVAPYVTISQGYTQAIAEEGDTIDHLADIADQILYIVKGEGRNGYKYMPFEDLM